MVGTRTDVWSSLRSKRQICLRQPHRFRSVYSKCDDSLYDSVFVVDEYGIILGIVTLENVLEQIVGAVDDEFDVAEEHIVPDGKDSWIVLGNTPVESVTAKFGIESSDGELDTFAGMLMHCAGRLLNSGDIVRIEPWEIRILETRDDRVIRASVQPRKAEEVKDSKATETEIIDPEATE